MNFEKKQGICVGVVVGENKPAACLAHICEEAQDRTQDKQITIEYDATSTSHYQDS